MKNPDIRLEYLTSADFARIQPWIDPRIFRIFHTPVDKDQLEILLTTTDEGQPTSLGYRIVRGLDAEVVGMIHATINWKNNLAHIGQIVIDPSLRDLGIGSVGLKLFLEVCFSDLCLHRAQLFVDTDNTKAIACYQKAGFQIEGLMREATRVGSEYVSWHSMSILEEEWQNNNRLDNNA